MSRYESVQYVCAVALAALLGSPAESRAVRQPDHFRAETALVRLDVLARTRGVPMRGLGKADFAVEDNGVPQEIEAVLSVAVPLHLCVVLDRSQSLDGSQLDTLKKAVQAIASGLSAEDSIHVIAFNQRIRVLADRTASPATIAAAIGRVQSEGGSSLRDALFAASAACADARRRSAVLLFTDGRDMTSWLTEPMLFEALRRVSVVAYAITAPAERNTGNLWADAAKRPDYAFLNQLARLTGGRVLPVRQHELDAAADGVLRELRARYLISYYPRGVSSSGCHEVRVRLVDRRGDVSVRTGYLVGDSDGPGCTGAIE